MLRNILIPIGSVFVSASYPIFAFILIKLFIDFGIYPTETVLRLVGNSFIFLLASVLTVGIFARFSDVKTTLFFGYSCSILSIIYWYVLRPVIYQVNNVLSDYSAWYTLFISSLLPLVAAFILSQHVTNR